MLIALIDSRSRWFVGSSSKSTFGFCSIRLQNSKRAASPPDSTFVLLDGSGLSRRNLVTPAATAQLLRYAAGQPWGALFDESLPVAGVDGSLAERFANTPASSITPDEIAPFVVTHNVAGPSGTATWFDTTAFKQPLDADGKTPHFGNMGRNNLNGPGLFDLDLSLFRKFKITEKVVAELRAETTNFTNTPSFSAPNLTVGDANFGKIPSTLNGLVAGASIGGTGPRAVTFALRIKF